MKVLVIPEDQELDQYIVKPVFESMLEDLGIKARIDVLPEPRLRGTGDALDKEIIDSIVADNAMEDLFILVIDRDCNRERNEDKALQRKREHAPHLLACLAVQEIEVWLLALYAEKLGSSWKEVREECDPKERWAQPLLEQLGSDGPGRGRKRAMKAIRGNWRSLCSRCPELAALQREIEEWRKARSLAAES